MDSDNEKVVLTVNQVMNEIIECRCNCHKPGLKVIHLMPCCRFAYIKPNGVYSFVEQVNKAQ